MVDAAELRQRASFYFSGTARDAAELILDQLEHEPRWIEAAELSYDQSKQLELAGADEAAHEKWAWVENEFYDIVKPPVARDAFMGIAVFIFGVKMGMAKRT